MTGRGQPTIPLDVLNSEAWTSGFLARADTVSRVPEFKTSSSGRGLSMRVPAPVATTFRVGKLDGALGELEGELSEACRPRLDLETALRGILDPASAIATIHWGRNYLYLACWPGVDGDREVVVKQFRGGSGLRLFGLFGRSRGTKAKRSWQAARVLQSLGVGTPEPVFFADSNQPGGASFFVSSRLSGLLEMRYLVRALNAGTVERDYPAIAARAVLESLGAMCRRLHDGGFVHRDLSSGNVLVDASRFPAAGADEGEDGGDGGVDGLYLVDLNRARWGRPPSQRQRQRDLSRMPLARREHQRWFLDAYRAAADLPGGSSAAGRGEGSPAARRGEGWTAELWYHGYRVGFQLKNRSKQRARSAGRRLADALLPRRRPHVHIPTADLEASIRDRTVWDPLSDQPHQHARRLEKLWVRVVDAPAHLANLGVAAAGLGRARRRARELRTALYARPTRFSGLGISVRPWPADPEGLVGAIVALGVDHVLLRLNPWQPAFDDEEALAAELARRGYDLVFTLPQNRDLVRDPGRWRAVVRELAERFLPYGSGFQIGQAINRSKWGVWRPAEYVGLFVAAAQELEAAAAERGTAVELSGPGIIDFEPYATSAILNLAADELRFDVLASLLYVDRRGAPENRQLGLDTIGKVTWLKALAETGRNCPSGRSWITEVNWPLREGPHAPAGRDVAVSEDLQASYLSRYFLLALGTGLVERVYWWQLVHRGYGLIEPRPEGLRLRPSFQAFRNLARTVAGSTFLGPAGVAAADQRLYRFRLADGRPMVVAWSITGGSSPSGLAGRAVRVLDRDGNDLALPAGADPARMILGPAPIFVELADG